MSSIDILKGYYLPVHHTIWTWESGRQDDISEFWLERKAKLPALFNGRILMLGSHEFEEGILRGRIFITSFASMLYWKSQGQPECGVRNIFGCAVMVSADGHLLFGQMGSNTAAAGRVYPFAGLPDLDDVMAGQLDLDFSIRRELLEETGLSIDDAKTCSELLLLRDDQTCAIARVLHFGENSSDLRMKILHHLENAPDKELENIIIFRSASEQHGYNMPSYARTLVTWLLT